MPEYFNNIEKQEAEDRYVATEVLNEIITGNGFTNVSCNPTPILCSVDLSCSCIDYYSNYTEFNVEIKRNNQTPDQIATFGNCLLKQDKLKRMFKESVNKILYFMVLMNEKDAYIFNCRTIDWSKIPMVNLTQKRTQFNPNSDWIRVPTYQIPLKLAKKVDCSKYYAKYKQAS